jgi:hypothetical protein
MIFNESLTLGAAPIDIGCGHFLCCELSRGMIILSSVLPEGHIEMAAQ